MIFRLLENAFAYQKIEPDIFTTPRQKSLSLPYHHFPDRGILLISSRKRGNYEKLFQNVLLKFSVFETPNRRM